MFNASSVDFQVLLVKEIIGSECCIPCHFDQLFITYARLAGACLLYSGEYVSERSSCPHFNVDLLIIISPPCLAYTTVFYIIYVNPWLFACYSCFAGASFTMVDFVSGRSNPPETLVTPAGLLTGQMSFYFIP